MSTENKVGDRVRKSTGRRSSILKRQDTCYLTDVTETVEKTNTPLKRRVSFANTATVRTFETLPWQSHLSDDSGSSSVNHAENDVFAPNPSLLVNVRRQCHDVIPPPVVNSASVAVQDEHQNVKEQDKTILFSQFNDSDCAMEITTNVSQLSQSWLDNESSLLGNKSQLNITDDSEPRVIFPWNNKGTDNNGTEKTQNMEFTCNLGGFPSLSARFLNSNDGNDTLHQENFPEQLTGDHGIADDMTADMEMTDIIETVSVPKRRSVLVDLTDNNNLTPIEEVSVSSMYTSALDHEPWTQHLGSDKKSVDGIENRTSTTIKSNSLFASPPGRAASKQPHSSADKDEELEVSFKFQPYVGSSPNSSQNKPKSKIAIVGSCNRMSEEEEKTLFNGSMEMTNAQLDDVFHCDQKRVDCLGPNCSSVEDMEITKCRTPQFEGKTWQLNVGSLNSSSHHDQGDSLAVKPMKSGVACNSARQNLEAVQKTLYLGDMEMTLCMTSKGNSNNKSHDSGRSEPPQQTVYNAEDMDFTHGLSLEDFDDLNKNGKVMNLERVKGSDDNTVFAGEMEMTQHDFKQKDISDCDAGQVQNLSKDHGNHNMEISKCHLPGKSDPQLTVYNTEDMNFTCNLSVNNEKDVERKESPIEKTLFGGEMEVNSCLAHQVSDKKDLCNTEKDSEHNSVMVVDNIKLEGEDDLYVREEIGSLHVSLLDKFLGSQELNLHHSIISNGTDENDSLHDSISLSKIAGMESPNKVSGQEKETIEKGGIKKEFKGQAPVETNNHQSILDYGQDSSLGLKNASNEVGLGSQELELDCSAEQYGDDGDHSISLSEIAGLKSPSKQNSHEVKNNVDEKSSSLNNSVPLIDSDSKRSSNSPSSCAIENVAKDISMKSDQTVEEVNKSMDVERKEAPQKDVQVSKQAQQKAALRKSLTSEMMFPNLASKSFIAKSFSHLSNAVAVAKSNQNCSENAQHKPIEGADDKLISSERKSDENKTEKQQREENMRFSSDFFEGEVLPDDGDCPTLEDAFDDIPLNESVQEELVFSYMRSIIEVPGDEADEKDSQQAGGNVHENFTYICQAIGIDSTAEARKEIVAMPVPNTRICDKLNAKFVVNPQITTLENYVGQLQEEFSRRQKVAKDNLDKFSRHPPQIYKDVKNAMEQGLDISAIKSRIQDMGRGCKGSTHSKHNRHKADYLIELTSAQQKGHGQQKKDLEIILSDIERISNVSAEIDKCMEELNVFSDSRSEIQQVRKKTAEIESETCQMKSQCNKLDKDIELLNKASTDRLHKMKDNEEEELLLLDKISFMSCLSEWSLLKQSKTRWSFGFLSNTIILNVSLSVGEEACQQILDISFRSRLSSKSTLWARTSHQLLMSSLDKETLMNRFNRFQQLNLLVAHVSDLAGVSRDLCAELKDIHLKHHLRADGLRIHIQLLSHDCQQTIELSATLEPNSYTTEPLKWQTKALLSPLSSTSIVDVLKQVTPGPKYIFRSLQAVSSVMARE